MADDSRYMATGSAMLQPLRLIRCPVLFGDLDLACPSFPTRHRSLNPIDQRQVRRLASPVPSLALSPSARTTFLESVLRFFLFFSCPTGTARGVDRGGYQCAALVGPERRNQGGTLVDPYQRTSTQLDKSLRPPSTMPWCMFHFPTNFLFLFRQ